VSTPWPDPHPGRTESGQQGWSEPEELGAVRVRVPAKINLHLGVGPVRPDGYHELRTVYQAISIYDEVTVRPGDTLSLTLEGEGVGELTLDSSNLVIRAATALAEYAGVPPRARIHLRKQIPLAAGLAGGSADAAATLVACDALWKLHLPRAELARLAGRLGADVPFLLYGGIALGTGYGERISPVLTSGGEWHWVVAISDGGLSTPEVYRQLDRMRADGTAPPALAPPDRVLVALRQRDPRVLAGTLGNDLAPAALALRAELRGVLTAGADAGALAGLVSGSGPTCVFLARDATHAAEVAARLRQQRVAREVRVAHGPVPGARIVG